ncbi:MAG: hypothetical protein M3Z04_14915 [Chloroflexota bacterium]|nr:hypothetical protein [Chloroflexota bacterium]
MDHPTQRLDPADERGEPEHPTRRLDTPAALSGRSCPKCSGEMIWAGVRDKLQGNNSSLGIEFTRRNHNARWLEPQFHVSRCGAAVCIVCGFAELYATQPKNLLGAT